MPDQCVVCHDGPGPVCPDDQAAIDGQLRDLPARLAKVAAALVPGSSPVSERVAMSAHITARLPARLDALSLLGPGGDVPPLLHPLVRHWSIKRMVTVLTHGGVHARRVDVEVTDWFHEAVVDADGQPVMVPDDDQIGAVPPREWLDMQVRRWRAHFGHHVPPRTLLPPQRPYLPATYTRLLHTPGGPAAVAFLAAAHAINGAAARLAYRGLLTYEERDPVLDDLEQRGRRPGRPPRTMGWDVDYLRTWLDKACTQDALDIAVFAAQLRSLHAEIGRVLGDTPDQEWIGRCPAFIADQVDDAGEPLRMRPCGAGLWQDNNAFSAEVRCPRCRTPWGTRGHAGAGTAREIRRVWPVDRRRRYNADEIDALQAPRCTGCGHRVKIEWRDVTGTRDGRRWWQPVTASCDIGCAEARRAL